jgi:hypothetical protein
MRVFAGILIYLVVGSFGSETTAAPIGRTVASETLVNAYGEAGKRLIQANSPIFSDDRLEADATGNAQIVLVDGTKIVVGPGAELRIDEFIFETDNSFNKLVVSVSKGAMRFISGNSKSSAYTIKTISGTIGIRGTALDVSANDTGASVALLDGELDVCNEQDECEKVDRVCDFVQLEEDGVTTPKELDSIAGKDVDEMFPMITDQENLEEDFRLDVEICGIVFIPPNAAAGIAAAIGGGIIVGPGLVPASP